MQHKNPTPKHGTIRTTTEASPWKDQLYKITVGGLKPALRVPNLILSFCSGSQHLASFIDLWKVKKQAHFYFIYTAGYATANTMHSYQSVFFIVGDDLYASLLFTQEC